MISLQRSFLSLDCAALAESLSSLPLHQRLDISLQLLELGEDGSETKTDSQEPPHGESSSTGVESSVVELNSCRLLRAKQPKAEDASLLDFHFTPPRSSVPKQVTLRVKRATCDKGAEAKVTPVNTSFLRSGGSPEQEQDSVSSAVAKPSEGDDILDQLLAVVPARQSPAAQASQSGTVAGERSNTPSAKPETAELDSMLDELLA